MSTSGQETAALRLVVADDAVLLREGLVSLLTSRGFDVVAQAGDLDDLLRKVAAHRPDVALVDIRMPPTGTDEGLRAAQTLGTSHPGVGVLVLSEHLDAEFALQLLEHAVPGRGYLLKETVTDFNGLGDAIVRVGRGGSVVDPVIVSRLLGRVRGSNPLDALSPREHDILGLMAEGLSNHGIAERLVVSERTVESYIRAIFQKLDLPQTADDHRRVRAVLQYLQA